MNQTGKEVDLNELPDKEFAKEMLWLDVVADLKKIIRTYPQAMFHFLAFYRKYHVVGHPRLGRLFMRIGRYISMINFREIDEIIDTKGDVIHGQQR